MIRLQGKAKADGKRRQAQTGLSSIAITCINPSESGGRSVDSPRLPVKSW